MDSHWRQRAREIIAPIFEKHGRQTTKDFYKEVRDAYPFGERKMHPYKIWLDEINVITGKRKFGIKTQKQPQEQMKLL